VKEKARKRKKKKAGNDKGRDRKPKMDWETEQLEGKGKLWKENQTERLNYRWTTWERKKTKG